MQNTWQLECVAEKSEHWELLEMRPDQYQDRVSHMTVEHLLIKNNTINEFIFNAGFPAGPSLSSLSSLHLAPYDCRLQHLLAAFSGLKEWWHLFLWLDSQPTAECPAGPHKKLWISQSFSRRVVSPRCRWGHVGCCLVDNKQLHVYNAPSIRTITLSKHTSAAWIVLVRKWCFAPTLQMISDKQFYCFIVICPLNGLLPL